MSQDQDQLREIGMEVDMDEGRDMVPMIVEIVNGTHRSIFARYLAERAAADGWDIPWEGLEFNEVEVADEVVDDPEVEVFNYEDDVGDTSTLVDSDDLGDLLVEVDPDESLLVEELDDLELDELELDEDEDEETWSWSWSSGDSLIALMEEDANCRFSDAYIFSDEDLMEHDAEQRFF